MTISAQPAYIGSTSLKPMFDALGLSGPDPIVVRSGNGSDVSEAETLELKPGERSLKARVLTLIENNRPNIAMDLMQHAAIDDPDLFEDIADDVYESLIDNGFDKDAEELRAMNNGPAYEAPKPDYDRIASALTHG